MDLVLQSLIHYLRIICLSGQEVIAMVTAVSGPLHVLWLRPQQLEEVMVVAMETKLSQSEPVSGRNPDVRSALLLDDQLHLEVHLIEAVALGNGWRRQTGRSNLIGRLETGWL